MKCRSEWQRPATAVRIRTSRGPGFGTLTSSITRGVLISCSTAAFIGVSSFDYCFVDYLGARAEAFPPIWEVKTSHAIEPEPTPPRAVRQPRPCRPRGRPADDRR